MANPYIAGRPVLDDELYGREELIANSYQNENNNIWLLGRRRSGKTSVLYAIEEFARKEREWFPVYITLEHCFSDDDIKNECWEQLQTNLEKSGLDGYQPPDAQHDCINLLKNFCKWLNARKLGLLVLLDEIEQLEDLDEGSQIERKLRQLLGTKDLRLRIIIGAARVLRTEKIVTSPFIGLFLTEYIGAIAPEEARRLILAEKNDSVNIQATEELINKILTVTACEPYLCQYLCNKLYQQDNSLRAPTDDDLTQLDANLNAILVLDYKYLAEEEKEILLRIAQDEQVESSSVPAELINLGYIKRVNGQYRIGNHFLARWLQVNVIQKSSSPDELSEQPKPPGTQEPPPSPRPSKLLDLAVSILVPVLGLGLIMGEFALFIMKLPNLKGVLLALATAILGFPILIFAGLLIGIIGESTFYKLFFQIIKRINLLSNLADGLEAVAKSLKGKTKDGNSEE